MSLPERKDETDLDILDRELRAVREIISLHKELADEKFRSNGLAVELAATQQLAKFAVVDEWRAGVDRERLEFVRAEKLDNIVARVQALDDWHSRFDGGLWVLRGGGFAGALALALEFWRILK